MRKFLVGSLGLGLITLALLAGLSVPVFAASAPSLGSAAHFAVLAGTSVTNTGATTVGGDLGVSPGTAVSGFPPGTVNGTTYAGDSVASQAQKDATNAYSAAVAQPCDNTIVTGDLTGFTLTPGVHCLPAGAILNGTVTLDAKGNAAAVFIIKVTGSLTTAGSSAVALAGSASHCNVYWVTSDFARIGALSSFKGNVIAVNEARMSANSRLDGRLISRVGAVKLEAAQVSLAGCSSGTIPTATTTATSIATGTASVTVTETSTAIETNTVTTPVTAIPSPSVSVTVTIPTSTVTVTTTASVTTTVTTTVTATTTATRTASPTATGTRIATVLATATIRRTPTGSVAPNTGRVDTVGKNEELAVILGFGVLGLAMATGAGLMLHRRRTF